MYKSFFSTFQLRLANLSLAMNWKMTQSKIMQEECFNHEWTLVNFKFLFMNIPFPCITETIHGYLGHCIRSIRRNGGYGMGQRHSIYIRTVSFSYVVVHKSTLVLFLAGLGQKLSVLCMLLFQNGPKTDLVISR